MAQCNVLYVLNPTKELIEDRQALREIFSPFGAIFKLFTDLKLYSIIKVYYENLESATNAFSQLHNSPPHFFILTIKSELVKPPRNNNFSFSILDENSSMCSNMTDDDVEVTSANYRLYDIFGKEIGVFETPNGHTFVSIDELKQHNFHFFKERFVPQKMTKEDFLFQLKVYISVKVRKFLLLHQQHTLKQKEVDSMITEVIAEYTNGGKSPTLGKFEETPNKAFNNLPSSLDNKQRSNNFQRENTINKRQDQPGGNVQARRSHINGTMENSSANLNSSVQKLQEENADVSAKSRSPKIPDYDVINIPLETPLEVSVTYVLNDRRCYVSVKTREQHLKTLNRRVQIEAMRSAVITPQVGEVCASVYEGKWYRATVTSTNPLKVQYLDFGNENEVPLKEVRSLSKELCTLPAEAICINFGNNPINVPLEYGTILNVKATRQNTDKSYQVKKASETTNEPLRKPIIKKEEKPEVKHAEMKPTTSQKSKPMDNMHVNKNLSSSTHDNQSPSKISTARSTPATKETLSPSLTPTAKTPEPQIKNVASLLKFKMKTIEKKNPTPEVKTANPARNTIMDVYTSGQGMVQHLSTIKDKDICFMLPCQSIDVELNRLESITNETVADKNYQANAGDCVGIYKADEEKWVRATVLNKQSNGAYSVALIDYGLFETTDTIRKLPKDITEIAEFCCVCTGSAKFIEEVKGELNFEIIEKNKFKVTYSDGATEDIVCCRWDPFVVNDTEVKVEEEQKPEPVFTDRPSSRSLSNDEVVIISSFNDGKLLARTKECVISYGKIKDIIAGYAATPLKLPPQINQIVLCPYKDSGELHRAIVSSIKGDLIEAEYIDLGFTDSLRIDTVRSISEPLAINALTLITIILNGFENGEYNEEAIAAIENHRVNKTKFLAKTISDGVFDLVDKNNESLAVILKKCGKQNDRFLYENLPKQNFKLGNSSVVCINCEQIEENVAFFIMKDQTSLNNFEIIMASSENLENADPYSPIVDEVCFALYDDEWFRARVLMVDDDKDEYKVAYIDYGNEGVVPLAKIRKLCENVKEIAPAAIKCKVNDSNGVEITTGEEYHIKVINVEEDGFYTIDMI